MQLYFEFSIIFTRMLDMLQYSLTVQQQRISLEEALTLLYKENPHLEKALAKNKFIVDGKTRAMFVCGGRILQPDSMLESDVHIQVVGPVCGGYK